jgi:hypothetical protein
MISALRDINHDILGETGIALIDLGLQQEREKIQFSVLLFLLVLLLLFPLCHQIVS